MKFYLLIITLLFLLSLNVFAENGDTIVVQTFTFGSPQNAWFVFPSDTVRFEKILMKYTLKCNSAQSPACGEWDYLTYTYLYKNSGKIDSTLIHQPIFTVNGTRPDSISYVATPSYSYKTLWQYHITHTNTTSLTTATIGTESTSSNFPFGSEKPVSRCQYLWKASEMTTAGITAGNITGLQFYLQTLGGSMRNLTIRMKHVTLDSLTQNTFNNTAFTSVYNKNTTFTTTGWNSIQLTTPFNWNGTSNLLIEINYENTQVESNNIVAASTTTNKSGLCNAGSDRMVSFHSVGYIDVPVNNQVTAIDSFVTISFWAYGNPAMQPMDASCFEAIDSAGNRILNSHTPWSDNSVYWDAGATGGNYDRISKAANIADIEGQWNFWAFTKNVATGSMRIYLNGNAWSSGTAKKRTMNNIKTFRIGRGNWSDAKTYEGKIDEFSVFNKELTASEIVAIKNNSITPSNPIYQNLVLYYRFNDGNYETAQDASPVSHSAANLFSVANPLKSPTDLINNFTQTQIRPNIVFEQGVYTSHLDSTLVVDTLINTPMQIITYIDSTNNPGIATDTLIVWPIYYNNFVYNSQGIAIDSSLVTPYQTLNQVYYDFYRKFQVIDRYEMARYITPYGNGLTLGTNGWTWTFDMSDYRTLLADSVHLEAGNWQELLDIKFLMIKGTPPRDVIDIQNLYTGSFNYGLTSDPIENHLQAIDIDIPANVANARWKSRITGHGMDSPQNCAEFCAKNHYFKVDGTTEFTKLVWRDNCDLNPLFPQGGTWVYDRANWCPGAEVWTYDLELTPFIQSGGSITLDHDVQAYTSNGPWDYFQIEDQLVTYGAPNFTLDASLEDIISPSTNQMHQRLNPICTNPIIEIKNTGSTTLTSLVITYGINGASPSVYNWTGNLKFMESTTVTLGNYEWISNAANFTVSLSNPNGGTDQYSFNNTKVSKFTNVPEMPAQFIIELKTNNYPAENQYTLKDASGNIILARNNLVANTYYRDTLNLANGCYEFELTDSGEDGLNFWANTAQGTGSVKFRKITPATTLKSFNADFGGQVYQQFTVGLTNNIEDFITTNKSTLNVYPNPTDGHVFIDFNLNACKDGMINIIDILGKNVYRYNFSKLTAESIEVNLSNLKSGVYFVTLKSGLDYITKKLMIE